MKPLKSQNHYEILGVPRHSSQEDIRRAFEICKSTYGDDSLATYSLFSDEENREIFRVMSQAFDTLCNPNTRREYDVYLTQLEGDPERDRAEGERMVASMIGLARETSQGHPARLHTAAGGGGEGKTISKTDSEKQKPNANGGEQDAGKSDARYEKYLQSVTQFDGAVLKKLRSMQGISIEDLADRTKIRITYLKYLEEENFEFLPAAVYVKGFITNVAAALDLPAKKVANDYMEKYRAKDHPS